MKALTPWLALVLACQGPATRAPSARDGASGVDAALATITPTDVEDRIRFLAADELRGRDTPSPGLEAAAEYLADALDSYGFLPAGDDGTFMQRYPYPLRQVNVDEARVTIETPVGGDLLDHGVDYAVGEGGSGTWTGMVYGGTRLAPDAVARGALRDRVVVVDLPGEYSRDWRIARNAAIRSATDGGAAGVVLVLDSTWSGERLAQLAGRMARARRGAPGEIPVLFLSREAGSLLFRGAGLDAAALRRDAREGEFRPVPFSGVTLRLHVPVDLLDDASPPNVVGVLPGSDPALWTEFVVLSAHMDHLGTGRPVNGDSIYNGADDNGSGTTAVLETAQALAALRTRPARSVVVLFVSGEEKGLLGSRYYTEHPTVPVDGIVADVNVDMVGRNAADSIVVIGQEYSSLGPLVRRVATDRPALGLVVSRDRWPEQRFFFRSDHFNFARLEIPALFFFAGVHEDYHRPTDEPEDIDFDKTARVARLVFLTTYAIATAPEPPAWTAQGLAEIRALTR